MAGRRRHDRVVGMAKVKAEAWREGNALDALDRTDHEAIVYFSSGGRQYRWQERLICRISRVITNSTFIHCSIATGGLAMDPTFSRIWLGDEDKYLASHRNLVAAVLVPMSKEVDLNDHFDGSYRFRWASIPLLLATNGRVSAGPHCTSVVAGALRSGGVEIPPLICSPARLYTFLVRKRRCRALLMKNRSFQLVCPPPHRSC